MQNLARLIFASYLLISFIPAIVDERKLRRLAGVRARCRNPERSRGIAFFHHRDPAAQRYSGVVTQQNDRSGVGLCADCRNMRLIKSDRGSVFYFCQLSATDARFPKYPRLPVLECAGYEKISTAEAPRPGENQSGS